MVSQRSGRHLESFLEAVRFILTEYGPVSSHGESICLDFVFQWNNTHASIQLSGYQATRLPDYQATRLPDYQATRLLGYQATRLPGYLATRLLG